MEIKSIFFRIGGMAGFHQINISFNDNQMSIVRDEMYFSDIHKPFLEFDVEFTNKFIEDFKKMNINKWKKYYAPINMKICDGEQWELVIEYQNKKKEEHSGSNAYPNNWNAFLELMDEVMFIIDNDRIDKLTIELNQHIKLDILPDTKSIIDIEYANYDTKEVVVLDRKFETIRMNQIIGIDCEITKEYKIAGGVSALLDEIYQIEPPSNEKIEIDNQQLRTYKLSIDYYRDESVLYEGNYNRLELPENWSEIIDLIYDFVKFYGVGDIFNKKLYMNGLRDDEYIYLSVRFNEYSDTTYYYRTTDTSIAVGDEVLVPVGKDNHENVGYIENIEICNKYNLPLPLEKTKKIIKKCK